MHTWQWHTWQGLPYLSCSLLQPWAHGFFTQQFSPRSPAQLVEVLQPQAKAYRVLQVHGNKVLTPADVERAEADRSELPDGDALITHAAKQAVWVASADCVPALIGDCQTGQVAAVHAGWRGTAAVIVPHTIARLQAQGSQIANLRVALGPAIAGEVYQVSTTVAAEVGATIAPGLSDLEAILDKLRHLPNPPILDDPQPGRARLDVRRVNALQLEQLGFAAEQISIAPYCTHRDLEYFFSYRRDRLKKVQWSGIVSNALT